MADFASPNELNEKIDSFVRICQHEPISKEIIESFEPYVIKHISNDSERMQFNNCIYIRIHTMEHDYILKFKDQQAIDAFFTDGFTFLRLIPSSFDYDDYSITLNNHLLNYTIFFSNEYKEFYTFEADSKFLLMQINMSGLITLHDDMYRLLDLELPEHIYAL